MRHRIESFRREHVEPAVSLFVDYFNRTCCNHRYMTMMNRDTVSIIRDRLTSGCGNPGVVVSDGDELKAFMLTGDLFRFKGLKTAFVGECMHAAEGAGRMAMYKEMYMKLADTWTDQQVRLHLIGHLSDDSELIGTLYRIGYGGMLSERLRDLSPVQFHGEHDVRIIDDPALLIGLEAIHRRYYRSSPIFITKSEDHDSVKTDLNEHHRRGDRFIVCFVDNQPVGYMILGAVEPDSELFLLQGTATAQVKTAFILPDFRSAGIGSCLLNRVAGLARELEFERLAVEHETANYYGGEFWAKHFDEYVNFSMRFIEETR